MSPTITSSKEQAMGNGTTANETPTFLIATNGTNGGTNAIQGSEKSQCSSLSDGENFEWAGENADVDTNNM